MKIVLLMLFSAVMLAGCGGGDNALPTSNELPTLAETSSVEITGVPEIITTLSVDATATVEIPPFMQTQSNASPEPTINPTETPSEPSETPLPTIRPTVTRTPDETRAFELNSTQDSLKTPRFSTLTPIPTDAVDLIIIPTIPVVAADVVITEGEFQQALNQQIANSQSVASAQVDFIPGDNPGMQIRTQVSGGQAMVTGDVFISFQLSGGLVAISVTNITVGSETPPQGFVDVVQDELFTLVVEAFDTVLTQRLGDQHDLEDLIFTETSIEVMLLVPMGN